MKYFMLRAIAAALVYVTFFNTQALADLREAHPDDDFVISKAMIAMRDGVRLHTVVATPKNVSEKMPILLVRTPYDATAFIKAPQNTHLHRVLGGELTGLNGYIFAFQDIRGRHGSEGEFVLARPARGPFNKTATDETTDAWDSIDWLSKNIANSNGNVGIFGTSYNGWTTLMALLDPHPALKAAVPVNPAADFWMGDDWFHHGAFRTPYAFEFVYAMETDLAAWTPFPFSHTDSYLWWLNAGSPTEVGARYLDGKRHKYWTLLTSRPQYDAYWQDGALDKRLAKSRAALVPTMHVLGLFDQEDIYGAPAAFAAIEPRDVNNDKNFFVAGPWYHGQNWDNRGDHLGELNWEQDTARQWRKDMLVPFLDHYLKNATPHKVAPAMVFNTGSRRWESFTAWPIPADSQPRNLYLTTPNGIDWSPPVAASSATAFISDPAKPVPYGPRPVRRIYDDTAGYEAWRTWLVGDQRFVDGRPDVLSFVSPPLTQAVTVRGTVTAHLFAETTGTDADWVVKLIDVFPEQDPIEPEMGGFQFMIAGDIMRGRYRESFSDAKPIAANRPLPYRFALPQVNHTFKPGHRIMVQVQSSWFPLYDRNPQRFIENLMSIKRNDYQTATHRIHSSAKLPSRLEVQVAQ